MLRGSVALQLKSTRVAQLGIKQERFTVLHPLADKGGRHNVRLLVNVREDMDFNLQETFE